MHNQSILLTCRCSQMPVRQNKEKNHHSRFHSDSQYRLLLFFFKFIGSDPKLPTTIEITYVPTPNIFRTWLSQNNDTFKLSNHFFLSLLHKIMIIRHFHISHNATYLSLPPPIKKYCITFVFYFFWVSQPSKEKLKTMLMQIRCIMGNVKVAYDYCYDYYYDHRGYPSDVKI